MNPRLLLGTFPGIHPIFQIHMRGARAAAMKEAESTPAGSGRAGNTTIDAVAATEIFLAKRPHKKR